MCILQITAVAEINLFVWIPVIIGVFANIYTINKVREENKEKMATKEYVKQRIEIMEGKIDFIEKEYAEVKDDIKYIRGKIDALIVYLLKNNKK